MCAQKYYVKIASIGLVVKGARLMLRAHLVSVRMVSLPMGLDALIVINSVKSAMMRLIKTVCRVYQDLIY
jgi:hypothetical protein